MGTNLYYTMTTAVLSFKSLQLVKSKYIIKFNSTKLFLFRNIYKKYMSAKQSIPTF